LVSNYFQIGFLALLLVSCASFGVEDDSYVLSCLSEVKRYQVSQVVDKYNVAVQTEDESRRVVSVYLKLDRYPERYYGGCVFYDNKILSVGFLDKGKDVTHIYDVAKNEELYEESVSNVKPNNELVFKKIDGVWTEWR
jgi:alpha-N-acetylglucosamine transferase